MNLAAPFSRPTGIGAWDASADWRSSTPVGNRGPQLVNHSFDRLDLFRAEPGRQAWLIRYGLTLAGFALTRPLEPGGTSMYAFFIVRGLRRHGVGLQAARELLRLIPGVWGIAFQDENAGAQPFWERVATDVVGDRWHLEKVAVPEGHTPDIWLRLDTRLAP